MAAIRVTEIWTYPVKSLRGRRHAHARLEPCGLAGDRRWMVVDQNGRFISQRDTPRMALVDAHASEDCVMLSAPGAPPLHVEQPRDAPSRDVTLWHDVIPAADAGEHAAAWLSDALGVACRLVYQVDPSARPVEAAFARPGDEVNLGDGFPVLVTAEESLADLNTRLAQQIPMDRFRPNLVVRGAAAWAEDRWRTLRIADAVLRVAKPCDRCVMTTIDQVTGERPDPEEPLRTLKTFRRDGTGRVLFGQNLVPERTGIMSVGDEVHVGF